MSLFETVSMRCGRVVSATPVTNIIDKRTEIDSYIDSSELGHKFRHFIVSFENVEIPGYRCGVPIYKLQVQQKVMRTLL